MLTLMNRVINQDLTFYPYKPSQWHQIVDLQGDLGLRQASYTDLVPRSLSTATIDNGLGTAIHRPIQDHQVDGGGKDFLSL